MGMNELHAIEVVLTYMDGEAVMLVKSAPTNDYDSGLEANAWISRAKTGRCRAIAMTPINGVGAAKDAAVKPEPTCPMDGCIMGPGLEGENGHQGPHQDKAGALWDVLDLMGNRVANEKVDGA